MNNIPPCYNAFKMPVQSYQPEKKKLVKIGPYLIASSIAAGTGTALIKDYKAIKKNEQIAERQYGIVYMKKWKAEYKKHKQIRPGFSTDFTLQKRRFFYEIQDIKHKGLLKNSLLYSAGILLAGYATMGIIKFIKGKKNANNI